MTTDAVQPDPREPYFTIPVLLVAAMAAAIVVLHGLTYFLSYEENVALLYDFALTPRRFLAPPGSEHAYPDIFSQLVTLVSTALLHGDWIHVGINALMLWQFGTQPARMLGPGVAGAGKWMLLFVVSIVAGSLAYLMVNGVGGGAAVGASGGTCGLIAADFLIGRDGKLRSPLSRPFLLLTLSFALINLALVFVIPLVLPFYVSWEAHVGGYLAGIAMMLILGPKARTAEAA
jgi:membrane associated rhomboid family serine protease